MALVAEAEGRMVRMQLLQAKLNSDGQPALLSEAPTPAPSAGLDAVPGMLPLVRSPGRLALRGEGMTNGCARMVFVWAHMPFNERATYAIAWPDPMMDKVPLVRPPVNRARGRPEQSRDVLISLPMGHGLGARGTYDPNPATIRSPQLTDLGNGDAASVSPWFIACSPSRAVPAAKLECRCLARRMPRSSCFLAAAAGRKDGRVTVCHRRSLLDVPYNSMEGTQAEEACRRPKPSTSGECLAEDIHGPTVCPGQARPAPSGARPRDTCKHLA
ncbi:hypothetical protein CC78DRAFT_621960 [Lojkania enalia]|uniref:Uncharacterized protein n=1 Tax=Lojkania enalia TaxID=147567 RepID=A0A9P4MXH0_9PLEO|nr:hypothetical protein CC78DRAFT_621960 [Didymosphaeria enalia]